MELVVKRQIIGVLALVFVLLVFFPLFFSGNGYKERHLPSVIPPAPTAQTFQKIEPLLKPLPDTQLIAPVKIVVDAPKAVVNVEKGSLISRGFPLLGRCS